MNLGSVGNAKALKDASAEQLQSLSNHVLNLNNAVKNLKQKDAALEKSHIQHN